MSPLLENLEKELDKTDIVKAKYLICHKYINRLISSKEEFLSFVNDIIERDLYHEKSHSNPFLKKLCIFESSKSDFEIRLCFYSETLESYHDHRWDFYSKIISGGYIHEVFSSDITEAPLTPILIHTHSVNNSLLLTRNYFHNITPEIGTISLLVKFKSKKEYWTKLNPSNVLDSTKFHSNRSHTILSKTEKYKVLSELKKAIHAL